MQLSAPLAQSCVQLHLMVTPNALCCMVSGQALCHLCVDGLCVC
mgnify:CR=1 FL=1